MLVTMARVVFANVDSVCLDIPVARATSVQVSVVPSRWFFASRNSLSL